MLVFGWAHNGSTWNLFWLQLSARRAIFFFLSQYADLIWLFPCADTLHKLGNLNSRELNKFCVLTTAAFASELYFSPPVAVATVRSEVVILLLLLEFINCCPGFVEVPCFIYSLDRESWLLYFNSILVFKLISVLRRWCCFCLFIFPLFVVFLCLIHVFDAVLDSQSSRRGKENCLLYYIVVLVWLLVWRNA